VSAPDGGEECPQSLRELSGVADAVRARGLSLGAPLVVLSTTGSTNDDAKRGAKAGAPHGATWVADTQSAGRGRQGRHWLADPGDALLVSVVLRIPCPVARLPQLSLAAGLAARDAAAAALPEVRSGAVRLKWPNDVEIDGRKVAGVLVESVLSGDRVDAVVVGVGMNVHARAFPDEIADRATSLVLSGGASTLSRADVLLALLAGLERTMPLVAARGLAPLRGELARVDALAGHPVRSDPCAHVTAEGSHDAARLGEGIAAGIDDEGRLLVRGPDGALARWTSGEAHLLQ
jgi:BirA family biotin operon repressor/biotin-[acetyl-CoA-carboxylase] ligase